MEFWLNLYPFLAVALGIAAGQFGIFYRRRKSAKQYAFWAIEILLMVGLVEWMRWR